jgi:ribosomal protein S18 acetylase RimI-like enzyme
MTRVEVAAEPSPEVVEAVRRLLPQLSSSAKAPSDDEVAEVVRAPATTLLIARLDEAGESGGTPGAIVGMLTLVVFRLPTGVRAWVEDVVVDTAWRARGVGEALLRAAVGEAARRGARTLDLTSRPQREAANRLYQRVGFEVRETNVYRLVLGEGALSPASA